jgi:hypothetical protein
VQSDTLELFAAWDAHTNQFTVEILCSYPRERDRKNLTRSDPVFEEARNPSFHGKRFASPRPGNDANSVVVGRGDSVRRTAFV